MPRFQYKAYDTNGAIAHGELNAATRTDALEALARRRYVPISLREGSTLAQPWWRREIGGTRVLSTRPLAVFTRELAGLVKASLPIDEALRIIAVQPALPQRIRRLTHSLVDRVMQGQSLSAALAASGGVVPATYVRLVEAGEASGTLSEVLDDVATHLERTAEMREKTLSQLIYPAFLIVAAIVALAVITVLLVPAIRPIFEDAGLQPPFIVAVLSAVETFFGDHALLLSGLAIAALAGAVFAWRTPSLRYRIDRTILNMPVAGCLVRESQTARLAGTLSALLRNGVPVTEAMQMTAGVLSNRAFSDAVRNASAAIERGSTLVAPLNHSGLMPELFLRLARVGEETGQLAPLLQRVAQNYEASVARRMDRLTTLLTPVLTILIGLFIGTLVISVMNAILSVNEIVIR